MNNNEKDIRKIVAVFEVEEYLEPENNNTLSQKGTLEYFENECGWLTESGIYFKEGLVCDEDDEDKWARYINYIIEWALTHSRDEKNKNAIPPSYSAWEIIEEENL